MNCGIGSNLTANGTVECEAAFIISENLAFGAVAAVTNCAHPIYAAHKIAHSNKSNAIFNGLIQPVVLVGQGANNFCESLGLGIVDENSKLETAYAKRDYLLAKKMLQNQPKNGQAEQDDELGARMDTVGGVAINLSNDHSEAGVSSGGMLLKCPGRIGHSTAFGSAIWAEQLGQTSIAISLSGCGEALIRTHLAEKLAANIVKWDFEDILLVERIKILLEKEFINSTLLRTFPHERLLVGGLVLLKSGASTCPTSTLIAFHNTQHFPFAFRRSNGKISKLKSTNSNIGQFVSCVFNLTIND